MFLEKYCLIEDREIFCSNSDEEYYDKECMNLYLETLKKWEQNISQGLFPFAEK